MLTKEQINRWLARPAGYPKRSSDEEVFRSHEDFRAAAEKAERAPELTDAQVDAVARFAEQQVSTDLMRAADALAIRHPVLALLTSCLALLVEKVVRP